MAMRSQLTHGIYIHTELVSSLTCSKWKGRDSQHVMYDSEGRRSHRSIIVLSYHVIELKFPVCICIFLHLNECITETGFSFSSTKSINRKFRDLLAEIVLVSLDIVRPLGVYW